MNSHDLMNGEQQHQGPLSGPWGQSQREREQTLSGPDCCAGGEGLLPLASAPACSPCEGSDQPARVTTGGQLRRGRLLLGGLVLGMLLSLVIASQGLLARTASPALSPPPAASSAAARESAPSREKPAPSQRPSAPDFTIPTLAGTTFHLAAQRGQVVMLYFMATGCAGCGPGSTELGQALATAHLRGVTAVAIDLHGLDRPQDLQVFVASLGLPADVPLQWGIDATGAIGQAYGVQELETTIVIDRAGQIAFRSNGPVPAAQLLQVMRQLA
ncbi:peroxiredoxin family protein [Thermogemmatispora tikiterensis]|uniref:Thioredoxin domain-containing protein n=1 Tax=Thermogemmatispora tikiterensis TaxID=1825093 RepID=A0A328V8W6_9CHLR|nr:TlpA disulfide reductase family protein [Thermogemmatispora tikiterensis]RAQ94067.1 hypothetical protein A4R35_00885 [Thermogemmatispora tikiterensis]